MEGAEPVTPALQTHDLTLERGRRTVLAGVDLAVSRGEIVALMGLSGAGKSTILRLVAGLEQLQTGAIHLDDVVISSSAQTDRAQLRSKVGLVFQSHCLFEHLTALDNVCLALVHVQRMAHARAAERAFALLDELGVGDRASAWPRELSGGEAQRVAIARALAMDPPLLLLDEPTASLDPARRNELGRLLQGLAEGGRALLLTSHDDDFVTDYATRVAILAAGRIVEHGEPRRVLTNPEHEATRELLRFERNRLTNRQSLIPNP
jgi:ABC-type polar amino acid transport system ATPase subunit